MDSDCWNSCWGALQIIYSQMNKYFYQPLKPFKINQLFGENKACVSIDGKNTYITCDGLNPPLGFRSLYGSKGHLGLDLAAWQGQEVYCIQRGKVYQIDTQIRSGLDVRIETEIDGKKFRHIYEHLLGFQHKVGDTVETGQLIGWADNTGYSSGNHLHLQVEQNIAGEWIPIDPLPLMENMFAKDILSINNSLKYIKEQIALISDRLADWLRR